MSDPLTPIHYSVLAHIEGVWYTIARAYTNTPDQAVSMTRTLLAKMPHPLIGRAPEKMVAIEFDPQPGSLDLVAPLAWPPGFDPEATT